MELSYLQSIHRNLFKLTLTECCLLNAQWYILQVYQDDYFRISGKKLNLGFLVFNQFISLSYDGLSILTIYHLKLHFIVKKIICINSTVIMNK